MKIIIVLVLAVVIGVILMMVSVVQDRLAPDKKACNAAGGELILINGRGWSCLHVIEYREEESDGTH